MSVLGSQKIPKRYTCNPYTSTRPISPENPGDIKTGRDYVDVTALVLREMEKSLGERPSDRWGSKNVVTFLQASGLGFSTVICVIWVREFVQGWV